MTKTLVNIIDPADPLPAYLFVKERYVEGDRLLFVATHGEGSLIAPLARLLQVDPRRVERVVLSREADGYTYERICRRLRSALRKEEHYEVNLAGGSRYMALAVQHTFESFDADCFYTQTRENLIVGTIFDNSIYDNDDTFYPIRHRMTIGEYLQLHGLNHDLFRAGHTPLRSASYTDQFFDLFVRNRLTDDDHATLGILRDHYRSYRGDLDIESLSRSGHAHHPAARFLGQLLRHIGFVPQHAGRLTHAEVEYLTGGWFEEWTYHQIRRLVHPDEAAIGVHIARPNTDHENELDVVFILRNRLYVVECKTGVQSDHLFNEIVYKACALRQALLGTATQSFLFSLKRDRDSHLNQVADMMGVTFCDRDCLTSHGLEKVLSAAVAQPDIPTAAPSDVPAMPSDSVLSASTSTATEDSDARPPSEASTSAADVPSSSHGGRRKRPSQPSTSPHRRRPPQGAEAPAEAKAEPADPSKAAKTASKAARPKTSTPRSARTSRPSTRTGSKSKPKR